MTVQLAAFLGTTRALLLPVYIAVQCRERNQGAGTKWTLDTKVPQNWRHPARREWGDKSRCNHVYAMQRGNHSSLLQVPEGRKKNPVKYRSRSPTITSAAWKAIAMHAWATTKVRRGAYMMI